MNALIRNLIPLFILFCAGVSIWYTTQNVDFITLLDLDADAIKKETDALENSVVGDIAALQTIDLSTRLFSLREYQDLVDSRVEVLSSPIKNTLPFGPIE
jgi:hypothetical protein